MNFDFSDAAKAKESGSRITPGIKKANFLGVDYSEIVSQKTGDTFKVLALKLDVEGFGEYVQNFFEPQSDERKELQWGLSASPLDHFKISVMQILEAVNPDVVKAINAGETQMKGSFKDIVKFVKDNTSSCVGVEVEVKFLPQSNGYASMPSFPARITKTGDLGIATRIIGHNLTLTNSELSKIEAAKKATPTKMSDSTASEILSAAKDSIDDDLPF